MDHSCKISVSIIDMYHVSNIFPYNTPKFVTLLTTLIMVYAYCHMPISSFVLNLTTTQPYLATCLFSIKLYFCLLFQFPRVDANDFLAFPSLIVQLFVTFFIFLLSLLLLQENFPFHSFYPFIEFVDSFYLVSHEEITTSGINCKRKVKKMTKYICPWTRGVKGRCTII